MRISIGELPRRRKFASALGTGLFCAVLAGCGTPGLPRPPTLELPTPVTDLVANRTADAVLLTWSTPRLSTDKLALRGPVDARVCRAEGRQTCTVVGGPAFGPGQAARFEDHLPPELLGGARQLLSYTVELTNHAGHSAGPSNVTFTGSGAASAPLESLAGEVRSDGVLLRWARPAAASSAGIGERALVRIHRELRTRQGSSDLAASEAEGPNPSKSSNQKSSGLQLDQGPAGQSGEEVLAVAEGRSGSGESGSSRSQASQGRALDAHAAFGQTYAYRAERVVELQLEGHDITLAGAPSATILVETRDVFPPATPGGLVALSVPEERVIDLSWTPDEEPDLAGYIVYRRDAGPGVPHVGSAAVRLSSALIVAPALRDSMVTPGRKYAYSVSAVDLSGNESRRSPEVEEGLPLR